MNQSEQHAADGALVKVKKPHPQYGEARAKAHKLGTTLNGAQKAYGEQLASIIHKLQRQFYTKYGDKMQELEDLEEAIANIQHTGTKTLKRQLTKLYMDAGDMGPAEMQNMQEQARRLCQEYTTLYTPDDAYQRMKEQEAAELRMAITGCGVGGGTSRRQPQLQYAPPSSMSSDDSDEDSEN